MIDVIWKWDEIESFCIKICVIYFEECLCMGCLWLFEEIGGWSCMIYDECCVIMDELLSCVLWL